MEGAKKTFADKFKDKTQNRWEERKLFEKKAGKYDLVAVDHFQQEASSVVKEEGPLPDSILPKPVQELVKLVCSLETMEKAVIEMQFDTRRAPLGKLTKEQITAGFNALQSVADCVERGLVDGDEPGLARMVSSFYILHAVCSEICKNNNYTTYSIKIFFANFIGHLPSCSANVTVTV